ncbi:MAG: T9SS type A sorting domain-containing protein [Candidatus Delongbacteria bacterium]|nr:T9SS type A sorting domain-containing protein [Candidatus Delongbacteria bacterium]
MEQNNRLFVIFIVILSFFTVTYTQQWVNISPYPDDNSGIQGDFISKNEGWVFKFSFPEPRSIFHTNNGGKEWNKIYTHPNTNEGISFIEMTDSDHGWMKTYWINSSDYPDHYLRTIDGGYTWNNMTEYIPIEKNAYYPFYFANKNIGFICTGIDSMDQSAIIYKTIDGGYNWYQTETHPFNYYGDYYPYAVEQFFFIDENYGWAGCDGWWDEGLTIYTTDGGENWYKGLDPEHNYIADIHFISPDKGGVVTYFPGASVEVLITNDNFETIEYFFNETEWNQYQYTICFQNDTTVWITGEPGIINRSTDGGATFDAYQTIDASLYKIQFFENVGYAFGYDNNALYKFDGSSGIEQECQIINCILYQNYPNPFNPVTNIEYSIQENNQIVSLSVYDIKGNLVNELFKGKKQNSGKYVVTWDGREQNNKEVSNGIYFYRLKVGRFSISKTMLLLK